MNEVDKKLGRVGLSLKKEYNDKTTYKRLDVVNDRMGSYISLQDNNVGNPLSDPKWWMPQSNSQPLLDAENKALVAAKKAEDAAAKAEGTDTGITNAETLRVAAEAERANAENLRVASEKRRIDAEVLRKQDEDIRKTNETSRADAEKTRIAEEGKRVSAESSRAIEFTRLKNESEAATRAAVTETDKATQATTTANNAAGRAANAATAASNAANLAGQKITEADTAINNARAATQGANTAKDAATKAATDANAAKASCDTATTNANNATKTANEAAANATTATGNMQKYVTEYNVSRLYPTKGIGGTDKYDLLTAIAALNADPTVDKSVGIKCSFLTSEGESQTYKYNGPTFASKDSWALMEYLADTPSGDPMHYMYAYIGAVWNPATGFWEINGLTDVTNKEMRDVYYESVGDKGNNDRKYGNIGSRTVTVSINLMSEGNNTFNFSHFFARSYKLETIRLCRYNNLKLYEVGDLKVNNLYYCFENDERLKFVQGYFNCKDVKDFFGTFSVCTKLQLIYLFNVGVDVSFKDSSELSVESIAYIITHSQSKPFTITLHPTAYARAIADTGVQAALAAHTNVSLASA